jgi:C-terminal processing protease CtpA/Prc
VRAGNIGYLKFDQFWSPDICGEIASQAMSKLADVDALIVDLRDNGGGDPAMVALISSYLFDKPTHLNDVWTRRTNQTRESWTRDVPGKKLGGAKPVYVLTSARTFSGAEDFSYNLKNLKRATIVGEQTGGGAHPTNGFRIDGHFAIRVPFARSINPISHTNWEGTGVTPDVRVPAADALETARRMISASPPRSRSTDGKVENSFGHGMPLSQGRIQKLQSSSRPRSERRSVPFRAVIRPIRVQKLFRLSLLRHGTRHSEFPD